MSDRQCSIMRWQREHPDPEYQRWRRKYPRFPGVAECVRLIKNGKARGSWADIIFFELAGNASSCFEDLVETFNAEPKGDVRLYIMMALEEARLPESVPFLTEVLEQDDERLAPYAEHGLKAINTPEARKALWESKRTK